MGDSQKDEKKEETEDTTSIDNGRLDIREELLTRVDDSIEQNLEGERNIETNLNVIFEPSEPSTSGRSGQSRLQAVPASSITVYNSENATCTILTNSNQGPSDNLQIPKGNQNNSVVLIFTQLLENLDNSDSQDGPSVPKNLPPDYSAVVNLLSENNPYKVTVRGQQANTITVQPGPVPAQQFAQNAYLQYPPPVSGAPPSYSAVLRLGPSEPQGRGRRPMVRIQPSPPFIAPPPPPTYSEVQGHYSTRDILASFDEYVWGPDPILIYCPRCATIVQTITHYHRSNLTHFSALALCLCGCWPCCLLPYCMKSCKNTYHHCPHCQNFLGMYSPW